MTIVVNDSVRSLAQFFGIDVENVTSLVNVYNNYRAGEYPQFQPDYAILTDANGMPYVSVCGTTYDSATQLYQPVCAAKSSSDNVIAVAGVYCEDATNCYRAIIVDGNVHRAPIILRLNLSNNDYIDVPMGFACGGFCIGMIAAAIATVGAAVVGYVINSLANKTEAEARKELTDVVVKHIERCNDAKCVATILSSYAPAIVEADVKGSTNKDDWLTKAKELLMTIGGGMLGLFATIMLILKLRIILDVLRGIFRRE